MFSIGLLDGSFSLSRSIIVLLAVGALASFDLSNRLRHRNLHLLFATVFGTVLSMGMIKVSQMVLEPSTSVNPFVSGLVILLVILGWKSLFGPWNVFAKATVLGTFLFWVGVAVLGNQTTAARQGHLLAGLVALVPALIWCLLFLKYHRERVITVILVFLAGITSTFPILFYDALVKRGIELQFFVFRIVPESFHKSTDIFVRDFLQIQHPLQILMVSSFVSFMIVALIEELSKYWVLSHSGNRVFKSIDDVMQLSIIVAIGFSFAENVVNPTYFQGFLDQYLLRPYEPDVVGFLSNVIGRSVLTSMVHIVSTGVLGYFLGIAIFAKPFLDGEKEDGHHYRILRFIAHILNIRPVRLFRVAMTTTGIVIAIVLHGCFNFLVTAPDLLPGRSQTIGGVLELTTPSILHNIPFLLVPSLIYVVGGFWLLTYLFMSKRNMQEHGYLINQEVFMEYRPEQK